MIEPKFRELMLAARTDDWQLRFWFSGAGQLGGTRQACVDSVMELIRPTSSLFEIEARILFGFIPEHQLSAYEILDAKSKNGIVGYLEWP